MTTEAGTVERHPFPMVIDSTMIRTFRTCPYSFYQEFILKRALPGISPHLHAGGAYAKGMEVMRLAFYRDGDDQDTALAKGMRALMETYGDYEPPDYGSAGNKRLDRMIGALEYYTHVWPLEQDTLKPLNTLVGPAVEFRFAIPCDAVHPQSGDPIIIAGRFDMLGVMDDMVYILDDKTTSSLGPSWSKQWDLRSQFTCYTWGAQQMGYEVQATLIRGLSILKTKYDHAQAIVYRPDFFVDRWYEQTMRDIERMKQCWETDIWDRDLDEACSHYGGCVFKDMCFARDPEIFASEFGHREWNPAAADPTAPIEPISDFKNMDPSTA